MGRQDYETETLIPTTGGGFDVAHALRADGFDASEDGTGRGTPLVPIAFDERNVTSVLNRSNPQPGDPCHTLHKPRDAILAFAQNASATPTLDKSKVPGIAYDDRNQAISSDVHHTLRSDALGSRVSDAIVRNMQVRRLTPRECERLQGFPDDYTLIPWRSWQEAKRKGISYESLLAERGKQLREPAGEECPDGPRYKALGNSMAVPVMRWIGERIAAVESVR